MLYVVQALMSTVNVLMSVLMMLIQLYFHTVGLGGSFFFLSIYLFTLQLVLL